MSGVNDQLHDLEREFGLPAREILDVINRRNRCKIAVRGAIAEAHLIPYLDALVDRGEIDGYEDFDRDGYPDYRVDHRDRSFLVEVKNVRKKQTAQPNEPIRVEPQRTRAPIGQPWLRYYLPSEFDIIAACLWNRTGRWEYRFAATRDLPRNPTYPERLAPLTTVDINEPLPGVASVWTSRLADLLDRL